jgi:hypothetical protein
MEEGVPLVGNRDEIRDDWWKVLDPSKTKKKLSKKKGKVSI